MASHFNDVNSHAKKIGIKTCSVNEAFIHLFESHLFSESATTEACNKPRIRIAELLNNVRPHLSIQHAVLKKYYDHFFHIESGQYCHLLDYN